MPTTARPRMIERIVELMAADGNRGTARRMNPNVPSFSMMLARTTEPAVGSSVCASGSHVWNGNIGTFTANPTKNAQNTHHPTDDESCVFIRSAMSKLYVWNCA